MNPSNGDNDEVPETDVDDRSQARDNTGERDGPELVSLEVIAQLVRLLLLLSFIIFEQQSFNAQQLCRLILVLLIHLVCELLLENHHIAELGAIALIVASSDAILSRFFVSFRVLEIILLINDCLAIHSLCEHRVDRTAFHSGRVLDLHFASLRLDADEDEQSDQKENGRGNKDNPCRSSSMVVRPLDVLPDDVGRIRCFLELKRNAKDN